MCFKSLKKFNVETCVLRLWGGLLSCGELWKVLGEFLLSGENDKFPKKSKSNPNFPSIPQQITKHRNIKA
jgi:hypothetical protein